MNQSGKKSGKNMRIVYGPVYPVVEKEEIIKIPSEKAGEKRIVIFMDLQKEGENFLEISASRHTSQIDEKGRVVRRVGENGKILTGQEEEQER